MKGKDVVVTGGAGFIGSHLVDHLVQENEVTVVDDMSEGREEWVHDEADLARVDVRDLDAFVDAVDEPDVILHLAASAHTRKTSAGWDDPLLDADINGRGTLNVFEAARREDWNPRIVHASSAAVYGEPQDVPLTEESPLDPISPYGIHKLTGEKYMRAFVAEQGIDASAVRIFNVFGPRQPRYVMYDFLKKLQDDPSTLEVLGTGRQTRDYVFIEDAVRGITTVADEGAAGEPYNMSGENVTSIGDLAELMVEMVDCGADIHYTDESWSGDPTRLEADISKLKGLGYEPRVDLREGLERFIDWFETHEGPVAE